MKKIKIYLAILLFSIVYFDSLTIYATDNIYDEKISECIELYDTNNEIVGYYVELQDGGYAIYNKDFTEIQEYSYENTEIYDDCKRAYYLGPLEYYEKIENNEIVSKNKSEDVEIFSTYNNIDTMSAEQPKKSGYYPDGTVEQIGFINCIEEDELSNTTIAVNNNFEKNCGSTAATIWLLYYYDNVNRKVISKSERRNYNELTKMLINYIEPKKNGSTYDGLKDGLNRYFATRRLAKSFNYKKYNYYDKLKKYINEDKPVIVGLKSFTPIYGGHWVVATGYSIYSCSKPDATTYVKFVKVNDGWGNKNVFVNAKYCDGIVYSTIGYCFK